MKEVLLKYVKIDLKGLLLDYLLETIIKPKLEEIVKDSSNPYDDMLLSYVFPALKDAATKGIEKLEEKIQE